MRSSSDLIHWRREGTALPEAPEWLRQAIPQHRSIWAPEARRFGPDGMRLYYCASAAFGRNNSWIGVAECPHFDPSRPTEGWRDLGVVISSQEGRDDFNAIDPSILVDAEGRHWMFFGSYWSGVYVAEIDPATGKLKTGEKTLVARNPRDRANGIEAPCAVYHDGYYYLIVDYGLAAQGVQSTYHLVVGRSKAPNGPFVDSRGASMTDGGHEDLLNSSSPMFGPGGGNAIQDSKGRWLLSLHYYDARQAWHGHVWGLPTLQIRELLWTADGWPAPGLPVTPETLDLARHSHASPVGVWKHQADFGSVDTLEIRKDGTCVLGGREKGKWSQDGDRLKLEWEPNAFGVSFTDEVELAYGGNYYVGRNGGGTIVRGVRVSAGGR